MHSTFIDIDGTAYYRGSDSFWYSDKTVAISCGWDSEGGIMDSRNPDTLPSETNPKLTQLTLF
jgi:hypothetical protein